MEGFDQKQVADLVLLEPRNLEDLIVDVVENEKKVDLILLDPRNRQSYHA